MTPACKNLDMMRMEPVRRFREAQAHVREATAVAAAKLAGRVERLLACCNQGGNGAHGCVQLRRHGACLPHRHPSTPSGSHPGTSVSWMEALSSTRVLSCWHRLRVPDCQGARARCGVIA